MTKKTREKNEKFAVFSLIAIIALAFVGVVDIQQPFTSQNLVLLILLLIASFAVSRG